jgi:hypothetical protein
VNRRELLIALGAALAACRALRYSPADPQSLDDHELATLAAIAEAFLPGTPGANEVDAVATLVEPAHGLLPYLSELVSDLDQWCLATKLKQFTGLDPAQRELVLEQRMGLHARAIQSWYRPAYEAALALTKLAFCDHPQGAAYLAFPGESRGYAAGSAAGAYASHGAAWELAAGRASTIAIAGSGLVRRAQANIVVAAAVPLRLRARIHAPGGRHHALALTGSVTGVELALAGVPAAGSWRLEIVELAGRGNFEAWSLRVRTDLDDRT